MNNPIMVGERVYLRALQEEDAKALALAYPQEPAEFYDDFGRYLISPMYTEHELEQSADVETPNFIHFASCLKATDEMIGNLGFFDLDLVNGTAESFAYFFPGQWRGAGYGTESKLLLLEYAFDRLDMHVIQSYVFGPNERSWRALARQGYQPAGTLQFSNTKGGMYRSDFCFDILREEWEAARDAWAERRAKETASNA